MRLGDGTGSADKSNFIIIKLRYAKEVRKFILNCEP